MDHKAVLSEFNGSNSW